MPELQLLSGERQINESRQAVLACNDYLRMGAGRSLRTLVAQYCAEVHRSTPPTRGLRTLQAWSSEFQWQERAEDYDAELDAEKSRLVAAERKAIMEEGIALDYKRVEKLKKLAGFLEGELYATEPTGRKVQDIQKATASEAAVAEAELKDGARPDWLTGEEEDWGDDTEESAGERHKNVWLRDYKGVAGVAYEIERFNAPLVEQFRETLDDIAKETGGRKQKSEISGPDGKPVPITYVEIVRPTQALSSEGDE